MIPAISFGRIFTKHWPTSPLSMKVCKILNYPGVAQLLESKNFERLIKRLTGERLDVQVNILTTCYNCISKGDALYMPSIAIASNALDVFSEVAKASPVVEVQVATCQCIMALWYICSYQVSIMIANDWLVIQK